jgi:energy-coupling factor transporter ATP-binding protein EcfA2
MSVLEQIVEWSRSRPLWQRDALRRLLTQPNLSSADYEELFVICKQQRGIPTPDIPTISPRPITESDIPRGGTSSTALKIKSIRNPRGVNALTTDAQLNFSADGLTIVYGDNATGKSGYVRLLKQLCRARGSSDAILPNIFDSAPLTVAEADIYYSLDGTDSSIHWSTGAAVPNHFREVSIFDEHSAGFYVDENCEVAYKPFGLDILPQLAQVCDEITRRIQAEVNQLASNQFFPLDYPPGTRGASIIERLDQRGIEEEIVQNSTFTSADEQRLQELTLTLSRLAAESPQTRAAEINARATRFQTLRQALERYLQAVNAERLHQFRQAILRERELETAVRIAQTEAFSSEPLEGIGTETWRALWEAARQFSLLQARQGQPFPQSSEGELCLLCLQPLNVPAIERFQRFENFVQASVQAQADKARQTVAQMRQEFRLLQSTPFLTDDTLEELRTLDSAQAQNLQRTYEQLFARIGHALSTDDPDSLEKLTPISSASLQSLDTIVLRLRSEATTLSSAREPADRERLVLERNELQAKQKLFQERDRLISEAQRRSRRIALRNCLNDTDTTQITRRNTELTDTALISVLAQNFQQHLQSLRVQHTAASITRGPGERGTAFHRIEIRSRRPVRASEVLSRGEHRAIAIAAFLAEVGTQDSASTIVFDDPVSSLDQDRRRYVAVSLCSLARQRPVVVFTHDLFFLHLLRQQAHFDNIPLTAEFLRREGSTVGIVSDGFPWIGQNVSQRIGILKQRSQEAAALHRQGLTSEYESDAKQIYVLLRESWERAVEEVLLNGAVTRFNPQIHTQQLRNLHGLDQDIINRLEIGMTKSSRLSGHDIAVTASDPVPDPSELDSDILELENWVRTVRQHHDRRRNN